MIHLNYCDLQLELSWIYTWTNIVSKILESFMKLRSKYYSASTIELILKTWLIKNTKVIWTSSLDFSFDAGTLVFSFCSITPRTLSLYHLAPPLQSRNIKWPCRKPLFEKVQWSKNLIDLTSNAKRTSSLKYCSIALATQVRLLSGEKFLLLILYGNIWLEIKDS